LLNNYKTANKSCYRMTVVLSDWNEQKKHCS